MRKLEDRLIMPNHIVIKDGLACGDKVTLLYDFDNEYMQFQLHSEGCVYCSAMCKMLQQRFNHKKAMDITHECGEIVKSIDEGSMNMEQVLNLPNSSVRRACCLAPVKILEECAGEISNSCILKEEGINLFVDKMDCDACATRENVSWLYQKPIHLHGQYNIASDARELLMKLGKLSLKNIDMNEVKQLYENMSDDEFEFMEEYKLLPMVYQNLIKMGILHKDDPRWRLLIYQRQRTIIAQPEVARLSEYIMSHHQKAYWVKGAFTQELYKEKAMRNLTDFDLLVIDENDAFEIIEWLIQHDYKIFPDSFSLKKAKQASNNVYTGHLHFQKIINLQYRMIVDVNFTGFPMIRVASYVPQVESNRITLESMVVVTLCHLFKHKEVFMKDINDLYLMLTAPELKVDELKKEIQNNGLMVLFAVVVDFLLREYEIPTHDHGLKEISKWFSDQQANKFGNWPYDIQAVKEIKKNEFARFAKDAVDVERIYLYPVIIFKEKGSVDDLVTCILKQMKHPQILTEQLTEQLIQLRIETFYFILSPIGIFLEMKAYYTENMKQEIRALLEAMVQVLDIEFIDIPYAIAFEEKWLDTEKE